MPREADVESADRNHEDDAWFIEGNSAARDRKARIGLAIAIAVLLLLGLVLGAFSKSEAPAGPDVAKLRARAQAAASASPLMENGSEALLGGLDRVVGALPRETADVVSAADGAAHDGGDVAAGPTDTGSVARMDPPPKAAEPKAAEPKATEPKATEPKAAEPKATEPKATEPKAAEPKVGEFTIPEPGPKAAEPKVAEPKSSEPKANEPKAEEPKPLDPKLKAPLDQALADAKAHLDAGRWAEARTAYEKALALAPGNARALLGRGRASLELRQVPAALKDIKAVLEVEPSNPTALLLAGSISQEQGQRDQARAYYQHYLDAWPSGRKAAEVKALLERL